MSLLLYGPAGSGKTTALFHRFRESSGALLITPTATLAQHLRHSFAKGSSAIRPARVLTLSQLVDRYCPRPAATPEAVLPLLVAEALRRLPAATYHAVSGFPGFQTAAASLLSELSSAGCDLRRLRAVAPALADVAAEVAARLAVRGWGLRGQRLHLAAKAAAHGPAPPAIFLDGFFSFTDPELEFLAAFAGRAEVTLTLCEGAPGLAARERLLALGFSEQRFEAQERKPRIVSFVAPTAEREAQEVARRVISAQAGGRPWRDIGVIARGEDDGMMQALRAAFRRFGIPARFYTTEPLAVHPAGRFYEGLLEALASGWDHALVLNLLRTLPALARASDEFDFAIRKRLPGAGFDGLLGADPPATVRSFLESLIPLEVWRTAPAPASEWQRRAARLSEIIPWEQPVDGLTWDEVVRWRSHYAALTAFQELSEMVTASFDPAAKISLDEFRQALRLGMVRTPVRVGDERRDAVAVLDAFEARQWRLPLVFVCGLQERQFPRYHGQDPLLPDRDRIALQRLGVRVTTSAERQEEERFLFHFTLTRAAEELVVSHARFDESGQETLVSFLARDYLGTPDKAWEHLRPPAETEPQPHDAAARAIGRGALAAFGRRLSASAIESYLQCPYQFFARRVLRLETRPSQPADRLNVLEQGTILHAALARVVRDGDDGPRAFQEEFDAALQRLRVPHTYRVEAIRLEMLRHLRAFLAAPRIGVAGRSLVEKDFDFALSDEIRVKGRIDRMDVAADGRVLVLDYKYSGSVSAILDQYESGTRVQAGLYLLAVERAMERQPLGMLYGALRKEGSWDGWHLPDPALNGIGEACTPERLRALADQAVEAAKRVAAGLAEGRVMPAPADPAKCAYCDFRDICRLESARPAVMAEGEVT